MNTGRYSAEWTHRLVMADSQHRGEVLVAALRHYSSPQTKRALIRDWFSTSESLRPYVDDLRSELEVAGFVADSRRRLVLPTRVWRGAWHDDDLEAALSWTATREVGISFMRQLTSLRAKIVLGIHRDDARPTLFEGLCVEAYGYLTGRGENEVLARRVLDIRPVAELRPVAP